MRSKNKGFFEKGYFYRLGLGRGNSKERKNYFFKNSSKVLFEKKMAQTKYKSKTHGMKVCSRILSRTMGAFTEPYFKKM